MRQALAAMWQAERFLRMAQPEEALAPENRALEILKELQQADREYVQRVGFEATPLDVLDAGCAETSRACRSGLCRTSPCLRRMKNWRPCASPAVGAMACDGASVDSAGARSARARRAGVGAGGDGRTGEVSRGIRGAAAPAIERAKTGASESNLEAALLRMLPPVNDAVRQDESRPRWLRLTSSDLRR
jgi:hypothetical protein